MLTALALSRLQKATKYVLVSLAFLLLCGQPVLAKEFHFNPASCRHDTGHMYFAFGRTVLALPASRQTSGFFELPPPSHFHYKAPDPTEPIGCFGNPVPSDNLYLSRSAGLTDPAGWNPKLGVPDQLAFSDLDSTVSGGVPLSKTGDEWVAQTADAEVAQMMCKVDTAVKEVLPNGFVVCRGKPKGRPNEPKKDWGATYVAKKDVYTAPLGKQFVVLCGPWLFHDAINDCQITYQINADIGIQYRFRPRFTLHPLPIDNVIAYDKWLRGNIEATIVKNYPWPK